MVFVSETLGCVTFGRFTLIVFLCKTGFGVGDVFIWFN